MFLIFIIHTDIGIVKVSSYIAQYPILRIAQRTLNFTK